MSLKQSCFKSIVKSDIKRSWWVSAIFALFMFLTVTTPLLELNSYRLYNNKTVDFIEETFINHVFGIMISVFLVLYIFTYINKVNSVSFFHGLPMKRSTLLSAHLTSVAILTIAPMLFNSIICCFAISNNLKFSYIAVSFLVYIVYALIAASLTLFVCMLTGVSVASGIFTGILALLPLYVLAFFVELCQSHLYGYYSSDVVYDFLVNYVYLPPEQIVGVKCLIYIIAAAVLIALSYFIYNKRHLENYGEVIAFPNLKNLFKVLFGLCAGALGYYYFIGFWNITNILTMLIFGLLGVIIAHMISNKSVSLKGVLKPIIITEAIVLLIFATFTFDLTGFENRVPDADDVESVEISNLYYERYRYVDGAGIGSVRVTKVDPYNPVFTSKEDIQLFIDMHEYRVENREIMSDYDYSNSYSYAYFGTNGFTFEYTLKNGRKIQRRYSFNQMESEKYLNKIYETDVYRKWEYPILEDKERIYTYVSVSNTLTTNDGFVSTIPASYESAQSLIEAVKKDREDISYNEIKKKDRRANIRIELTFKEPYVDEYGNRHYLEESETYYIENDDVNTMSVLEELNLFLDEPILTVDDVVSAAFTVERVVKDGKCFDEKYYYDFEYSQNAFAEPIAEVKEIATSSVAFLGQTYTERQDVEQLFDFFANGQNDAVSFGDNFAVVAVEIHCGMYGTRSRSMCVKLENLPEIIEKSITF